MKTQYEELISDPEFRKHFVVEGLVADAAELISTLMQAHDMNKADLADLLGKSRSHVTQLLSGSNNITVRTLAEVAYALGSVIKLNSVPWELALAESKEDRCCATKLFEMPRRSHATEYDYSGLAPLEEGSEEGRQESVPMESRYVA